MEYSPIQSANHLVYLSGIPSLHRPLPSSRAAMDPKAKSEAIRPSNLKKKLSTYAKTEYSPALGECKCGWYRVNGACGHTWDKPIKHVCGSAVSNVTDQPIFCKTPAPKIDVPKFVSKVRCKTCREGKPSQCNPAVMNLIWYFETWLMRSQLQRQTTHATLDGQLRSDETQGCSLIVVLNEGHSRKC